MEGLSHGHNPVPMAAVLGGLLQTGGIPGKDRATGQVPVELADEIRHMFDNLVAVLEAGGAGLDDVLRLDVTQAHETRDVLNEEWVARFPDPATRPARKTSFGTLPPGLRVQCQCVAVLPTDAR